MIFLLGICFLQMSNEVSVTVPHLEGSGTTHTVFKGLKRPYRKECILIIGRKTGEITLERFGVNVQLKKTRSV
jgi:ELL-associated factor